MNKSNKPINENRKYEFHKTKKTKTFAYFVKNTACHNSVWFKAADIKVIHLQTWWMEWQLQVDWIQNVDLPNISASKYQLVAWNVDDRK